MKSKILINLVIFILSPLMLVSCNNTEKLFPDEVIGADDQDLIDEKYGIIYEIDISLKAEKDLKLYFSGFKEWKLLGETKALRESDFRKSIKAAVAAEKQSEYPKDWVFTDTTPLKKNCKVRDTPRKCDEADTDLSARNDKVAYIGFVIKNNKRNWQFSSHADPIRIFENSNEQYYKAVKRINLEGKVVDGSDEQVGSRAVYLSANGPGDVGTDGKYIASFNLYTDVVSMDGFGSYIPVVVDPDVRWPGGSAP